MAGQPEHHKAVDQANANDAANGIPVDPRLDPRFATHRAAQQRLDPNNSASPTPPLDDFSTGAGAGASGESASASGSASDTDQSGAETPADLDSTLAAVRRDTERQKRFVIMADKSIKRTILAMLKERGQVYHSGNTAVITIGLVTVLEKQR